ncbi:DNA polymerase III subunit delta' [Candidatus Omnitrophota bacterium]
MVLLKDIKGQDNAVRYLARSMSSGRIAGSYLFSGPRGVGRGLTAKAFIAALICGNKDTQGNVCGLCPACKRIDTLEHPDILWISPGKNKKIKIEEIRNVKEALSLKPFESPVNVCVIEDAHMMTREASNALLKVLEEPPGHSIIILITNKKELLLETVISRCMEVRFRPMPVSEAKDIIMELVKDTDEEMAYFLAYFSQGSPGRALEMIDEGLLERKDDLIGIIDNIVKERNPSCLNWDQENRDVLLEDLEMLIMFFRDMVMGKEGVNAAVIDEDLFDTEMYRFFEKYQAGKIYDIVEKLVNMKWALVGNVNPKLVAQALPGILK